MNLARKHRKELKELSESAYRENFEKKMGEEETKKIKQEIKSIQVNFL